MDGWDETESERERWNQQTLKKTLSPKNEKEAPTHSLHTHTLGPQTQKGRSHFLVRHVLFYFRSQVLILYHVSAEARRPTPNNSNKQLLYLVFNLGQNLHKQLRPFVPNLLLHHRLQCPHPCSTAR